MQIKNQHTARVPQFSNAALRRYRHVADSRFHGTETPNRQLLPPSMIRPPTLSSHCSLRYCFTPHNVTNVPLQQRATKRHKRAESMFCPTKDRSTNQTKGPKPVNKTTNKAPSQQRSSTATTDATTQPHKQATNHEPNHTSSAKKQEYTKPKDQRRPNTKDQRPKKTEDRDRPRQRTQFAFVCLLEVSAIEQATLSSVVTRRSATTEDHSSTATAQSVSHSPLHCQSAAVISDQ